MMYLTYMFWSMDMMNETVLTPEQVAEYLKVPTQAVLDEIAMNNLPAMRVGNGKFLRVTEFDLANYMSRAKDGDVAPRSPRQWQQGIAFEHIWPDGLKENYDATFEGTAADGSRNRYVKIGFTVRRSAGMDRRRAVIFVDGYPTVEFIGANDFESSKMMASVVKDVSRRQVPVGGRLPPEYSAMNTAKFSEYVKGPRASTNTAVICSADDLETMVKHALIRTRYLEENPSRQKQQGKV